MTQPNSAKQEEGIKYATNYELV